MGLYTVSDEDGNPSDHPGDWLLIWETKKFLWSAVFFGIGLSVAIHFTPFSLLWFIGAFFMLIGAPFATLCVSGGILLTLGIIVIGGLITLIVYMVQYFAHHLT